MEDEAFVSLCGAVEPLGESIHPLGEVNHFTRVKIGHLYDANGVSRAAIGRLHVSNGRLYDAIGRLYVSNGVSRASDWAPVRVARRF
jgi:hypothetical protein